MRPDIDWKGIAHCWETLVKENQKQAEVLRILKKYLHFGQNEELDEWIAMDEIYSDKDDFETIAEWLEEK